MIHFDCKVFAGALCNPLCQLTSAYCNPIAVGGTFVRQQIMQLTLNMSQIINWILQMLFIQNLPKIRLPKLYSLFYKYHIKYMIEWNIKNKYQFLAWNKCLVLFTLGCEELVPRREHLWQCIIGQDNCRQMGTQIGVRECGEYEKAHLAPGGRGSLGNIVHTQPLIRPRESIK